LIPYLRRQRNRLDAELTSKGLAHTVSLPPYLLHEALTRELGGLRDLDVLDAGSGRSPYLPRLVAQGCRVVSVDIENRSGSVDVVGDLQQMPQVASERFDLVLCTQVLEHLPRPWRALAEIRRVLRPGGRLVLSAPHLSPVHEAPLDFYRYTRFGLEALAAECGLEVVEIRPLGGLLAFLGHEASVVLLAATAPIPLLGRLGRWLNYLLLVRALRPFDRWLGFDRILPVNHLLLARRPAAQAPAPEPPR
jgi:SAM-dependent methyltransferase